jgi:AcrR family transcriptional regulator
LNWTERFGQELHLTTEMLICNTELFGLTQIVGFGCMADIAIAQNDNLEGAKRQQILDGAKQCFLAQGFDGASMNDIVKAAGVSKGTVYAYFPSKEKLFEALIFRDRRNQAEQVVVIEDYSLPMEEVLRQLAKRLGGLYNNAETLAYLRLVIAAADKFPDIGRAFYEAGPAYGIAKIADYLQHKMDDGTLVRADARLAAMQFVELVQCGLIKPRLFASEAMSGNYSEEDVAEAGIALFLKGMVAG